MDRTLRIKTIIVTALIALSVVYLLPTFVAEDHLPSWFTSVFNKRVKLGLDLQGGLHIVYRVDLDKVIDDKAGELKREIEATFAEQKIEATIETPRPNAALGIPLGALFIVPKQDADRKKFEEKVVDEHSDSLVKTECPADRKGAICLRVASDYADKIKSLALEQAKKTIDERVNKSGVSEPTIVKKGDDIVVELPGTDDKDNERIRSIINRTAQLEFKMVDDGPSEYMKKLAQHVQNDKLAKDKRITVREDAWVHEGTGAQHADFYLHAEDGIQDIVKELAPKYGCSTRDKVASEGKVKCRVTGQMVMQDYLAGLPKELQVDGAHQISYEEIQPNTVDTLKAAPKSWRSYYLHRTAELTGTAILESQVIYDPTTNRPEVLITFNRYGARRFGDLTSKNVGRKMAILLDERVNSAPVIQSAITGGRSTITLGGGDPRVVQREAEDLVRVLKTGALPAPLIEVQSSQVGALLGQDAVDRAQLSMGVGAALVILLMLFFYKFSGVIANVAMVLNILFQVAILAMFQATLTLPGIAGLVLTVGMAVDSNIIIYERIREELRAGKSVRGAVDAGFSRAFWTVFDAHVTNFVAGFVLMEYGTGPIRGFAVTLLIGVVCNLFTSTWVSRLFFEHYINRRRTATAMISI